MPPPAPPHLFLFPSPLSPSPNPSYSFFYHFSPSFTSISSYPSLSLIVFLPSTYLFLLSVDLLFNETTSTSTSSLLILLLSILFLFLLSLSFSLYHTLSLFISLYITHSSYIPLLPFQYPSTCHSLPRFLSLVLSLHSLLELILGTCRQMSAVYSR